MRLIFTSVVHLKHRVMSLTDPPEPLYSPSHIPKSLRGLNNTPFVSTPEPLTLGPYK